MATVALPKCRTTISTPHGSTLLSIWTCSSGGDRDFGDRYEAYGNDPEVRPRCCLTSTAGNCSDGTGPPFLQRHGRSCCCLAELRAPARARAAKRPWGRSGAYAPAANPTWVPTVNASAPRLTATSDATLSSWTRTRLKFVAHGGRHRLREPDSRARPLPRAADEGPSVVAAVLEPCRRDSVVKPGTRRACSSAATSLLRVANGRRGVCRESGGPCPWACGSVHASSTPPSRPSLRHLCVAASRCRHRVVRVHSSTPHHQELVPLPVRIDARPNKGLNPRHLIVSTQKRRTASSPITRTDAPPRRR